MLLLLFDWERMNLSTFRPLKDPRNVSGVEAESDPLRKAFRPHRLETKMLLALGHDADGQLACYLAALGSW